MADPVGDFGPIGPNMESCGTVWVHMGHMGPICAHTILSSIGSHTKANLAKANPSSSRTMHMRRDTYMSGSMGVDVVVVEHLIMR